MQAVRLKAKITANHQLDVSLPETLPEGDAEVIIMYANDTEKAAGEGLLPFLESLDGKNYPRRSMSDIMEYLQEERASWDDKHDISG